MPVNTQNAVDFCNNYIRSRADALAQEYTRAIDQIARWNALGGGAAATAIMAGDIQKLAQFFADNQANFIRAEAEYNEWGQTLVTAGAGAIWDNGSLTGPDPNRPNYTADQARTLVTHWRERVNWLGSTGAVWVSTTPLVADGANMATVILAARNPTAANCGTAITRWTELQTQYTAGGNAVLNAILAIAVNPTAIR